MNVCCIVVETARCGFDCDLFCDFAVLASCLVGLLFAVYGLLCGDSFGFLVCCV